MEIVVKSVWLWLIIGTYVVLYGCRLVRDMFTKMLYVITREGVYRHEILGVFDKKRIARKNA